MNSATSKRSILIIDDSEELLEVFAMILEKHGYEVITKPNSTDISFFVQANTIDLLFLDVFLPGTNGRDICRELKSNPETSYFPIILMSATPENLIDFGECLADDFIEKPFDLDLLTEKLNSVLELV